MSTRSILPGMKDPLFEKDQFVVVLHYVDLSSQCIILMGYRVV